MEVVRAKEEAKSRTATGGSESRGREYCAGSATELFRQEERDASDSVGSCEQERCCTEYA